MVLHIEFQTEPDERMPFRMLDYRVRVYRRFPNKAMRQVVIYLKPTGSPLVQQDCFELAGTRHQFEVLRLWEQPVEALLSAQGLLPFAVLGNTANPESVLQAVSQKIVEVDNRQAQNNLAAATALLAGLVLEEKMIRTILRQEMIQESTFYQAITAEAEAKGRAKGRAEGRAEGEVILILRLLKRRIGKVPPQLQAQIQQLSLAQLEELGEAFLDFEQESDLEAWLAR
ncbi:MAG: Rpn family recombination-promoting nuclease/putative transposase [Cyanophyceae cyanobacterium]